MGMQQVLGLGRFQGTETSQHIGKVLLRVHTSH